MTELEARDDMMARHGITAEEAAEVDIARMHITFGIIEPPFQYKALSDAPGDAWDAWGRGRSVKARNVFCAEADHNPLPCQRIIEKQRIVDEAST